MNQYPVNELSPVKEIFVGFVAAEIPRLPPWGRAALQGLAAPVFSLNAEEFAQPPVRLPEPPIKVCRVSVRIGCIRHPARIRRPCGE